MGFGFSNRFPQLGTDNGQRFLNDLVHVDRFGGSALVQSGKILQIRHHSIDPIRPTLDGADGLMHVVEQFIEGQTVPLPSGIGL